MICCKVNLSSRHPRSPGARARAGAREGAPASAARREGGGWERERPTEHRPELLKKKRRRHPHCKRAKRARGEPSRSRLFKFSWLCQALFLIKRNQVVFGHSSWVRFGLNRAFFRRGPLSFRRSGRPSFPCCTGGFKRVPLARRFALSRQPSGRPRPLFGAPSQMDSKRTSRGELLTTAVSLIPLIGALLSKIGSVFVLIGAICSTMGVFSPFFERGFEIFTLIGTLSGIVEAIMSIVC